MSWNGKRTICEVLREIGDSCSELSVNIVEGKNMYVLLEHVHTLLFKANEATIMAKKMDKKLREYKSDYDEAFWEPIDRGNYV